MSRLDSSQHRNEKEWQATLGLGHVAPFFGPMARFSLFLDPDALIFLELSGGTTGNGFSPLFYVEGSGFFRLVSRNPNQYSNNIAFSSRSIGAEFLMGNQWQFKRFTLGCDWLGFQAPFAILSQNSQNGENIQRKRSTRARRFLYRLF